jgi:hypothetical protein
MNTPIQLCLAAYFALASHAFCQENQENKDFTITIDGVDVGINLEDTLKAKSADGKEITVSLKRNEITTFRGQGVSFQHKSGFSVATSAIDSDIEQHLLASALGTVVIVQRYGSINPATLTSLMLQELTKDEVNAGAKLESSDTNRTLSDGTNLTGVKATVTGKSETTNVEILILGGDDEGFIAITRIDTENLKADQPILDQFWKTLSFKK